MSLVGVNERKRRTEGGMDRRRPGTGERQGPEKGRDRRSQEPAKAATGEWQDLRGE